MFPPETIRSLPNEASLIADATEYNAFRAAWGTLHDYGNVTVPAGIVLVLKFDCKWTGTSYHGGAIRLKVGSIYIFGMSSTTDIGYTTYSFYVLLAAGTYDILVEGKSIGDGNIYCKNMYVGYITIPDTATKQLAAYSSTVTLNLASRTCILGSLNRGILHVFAYAVTPLDQTNMENIGDTLTNGVAILVDGSQVNWTLRNQDPTSAYGGASGRYSVPVTLNANHTIAFSKRNANTNVYLTAIITPWLLSDDATTSLIIKFEFPQGSTAYLVTEPLVGNPTVNIKFGKTRAISFGDSIDFFGNSISGTGILVGSYTFETPNPTDLYALVYGFGAMIARLLLDVR